MVAINAQVLLAVTAVGTVSRAIDTLGGGYGITMATVTSGTISSGQLKLRGSPDSTNWADLVTRTLTAGGTFFDPAPASVVSAVRYLRAEVTGAIVGGGSVTVYITVSESVPRGFWVPE
jgi:hypothetical protein